MKEKGTGQEAEGGEQWAAEGIKWHWAKQKAAGSRMEVGDEIWNRATQLRQNLYV